ncbi:MAG: molybdopterin converting factor subunit 1, partial [Chloroflexota bacterium]
MQIEILLFATLKEAAGKSRITLELPEDTSTIGEVRAAFAQRFPEAKASVEHAIAALNEDYSENEDVVQDGDKVAFFPPVSGGSNEPPTIAYLADS